MKLFSAVDVVLHFFCMIGGSIDLSNLRAVVRCLSARGKTTMAF
jgi:hypothetical protein